MDQIKKIIFLVHKKEFSSMKLTLLHPSTFKLDGGAMFGIIPKPLWERKIAPDDQNRILMSLRVLLIETENRKILVDTGIGDYHNEKFKGQFDIKGQMDPLACLLSEELQIKAEEITDIVLTHLHFDHVGGLGGTHGTELVFPKARIHLHKKHYEYSLQPTARDKGSFQSEYFKKVLDQYQEKGQVNFLEAEESGVILKDGSEDVSYRVSFGHTPYMIHPIAKNYIYMADLVPMAHHIRVPWVMGYDISPGVTTIYKEKFYDFILKNKLTMIFEHDLETWGATLAYDDKKGYQAGQLYQSEQTLFQPLV